MLNLCVVCVRVCECVDAGGGRRRREEEAGGGGGGDPGYRIKSKNPTQSCGEINPQTIPNNSVPLNPKD